MQGWGPTVDGVELKLAPERYLLPNATTLAANTSIAKVPIMMGWARDEGGGFNGATPGRANASIRDINPAEFRLWAQLKFDLTVAEVTELSARYSTTAINQSNLSAAPAPSGPPFHPTIACNAPPGCARRNCSVCAEVSGAWWAFARATTDQSMACAARRAARYWVHKKQQQPRRRLLKNQTLAGDLEAGVYLFSFDHPVLGGWNEGCVDGDAFQSPGLINPGTNVSANICAPHRMPLVNSFAGHATDIPFWCVLAADCHHRVSVLCAFR